MLEPTHGLLPFLSQLETNEKVREAFQGDDLATGQAFGLSDEAHQAITDAGNEDLTLLLKLIEQDLRKITTLVAAW